MFFHFVFYCLVTNYLYCSLLSILIHKKLKLSCFYFIDITYTKVTKMFLHLLLLIPLVVANNPNFMIHLQRVHKYNVKNIKKNLLIYKYTIRDGIKNGWIKNIRPFIPIDDDESHLFVHITSFI